MTTIAIEITQEDEQRLRARARALAVTPEALASAVLKSGLAAEDSGFERLAAEVIEKNRELYRRLS